MEALNMNNLLDAPENSDKAKYASWVTSVPVGLTFATLGLVGNTVSLIVWDRVARKTDVSGASIKYFKLLGVVNSCFLISYFLADTLQSCLPSLLQNYIFLSLYSYCFFPLFYYFNYATIWTMFAINIERYLICVRQIRLSNWTRMVLLIMMYIFGIILFWFRGFKKSDPAAWTAVNISFAVGKLAIVFHSSLNCMLYFITGSLFRSELRLLLTEKLMGKGRLTKLLSESNS
eukprot:GFUD01094644.1.p1 GENE.GFUD01094644.1~~GFUD01094644.1.p1  ORF type:complete len:243 (+),score=50.73 GFUD01094644.1:36-731(+)